MMITVKLFASYREAVGKRELSIDVPADTTAGGLLSSLAERYPALRPLAESATFAVNRRYVASGASLHPDDELTILPPVAGGADALETGAFEIVREPIDPAAVTAKVEDPSVGGIVVFTGVVRESSNSGRAVTHLEYEAYPEMAVEQMEAISGEIRERWGPLRIAVTHRVGRMAVGEAAVVIAVGAPHRAEAFAACNYAIDRLKEIVPIWKKEHGPDGATWVE
jgi:molybdopterin synthase catalytic subunit/molybdopterin converting factor small subunit